MTFTSFTPVFRRNSTLWALCSFMILGLVQSAQAQNLTPNYSFEDMNQCPTGANNISMVAGASDVLSWYSPTNGNPDYYNQCNPNLAPANIYGFQLPYSGDGYAGFTTYAPNNTRDYVAVQLPQPLIAGSTYCLNFNVSLADFTYMATSNIGVYFSNNSTEVSNIFNGGLVLNGLTPQIEYTGLPITDVTNWVNISGNFTPTTSGYQWIVIGNFRDDNNTSTLDVSSPGVAGYGNLGYYYIDDVSLNELPAVSLTVNDGTGAQPIANNGVFTTCQGNFVSLGVSAGTNSTFSWTTATNPFVVLSETNQLDVAAESTETYIVTINDIACSRTEQITIEAAPQPQPSFVYMGTCNGYLTYFIDQSYSIVPGAEYNWYFSGDGLPDGTPDATTFGGASYLFPGAGTYNATLEIVNSGSCVNSYTAQIEILASCNLCENPLEMPNMVPNFNATIYTECPDSLSVSGQPTQVLNALPWQQPTAGTTDFFHSCAAGGAAGVPLNQFGFQKPSSGLGYFGFYALRNADYREYVSVKLTEPMLANQNYCVSFDVSLADKSGMAIANLGAYFSNAMPSNPLTQAPLVTVTPQVRNLSTQIISNKSSWTTITGVFQPTTSGVEWITIGNFLSNANTNQAALPGTFDLPNDAYYYLDNIRVMPLPELSILHNSLPTDSVAACVGDSLTFSVNNRFCSYNWREVNNPNITLSSDSTFTAVVTTEGTRHYVVSSTYGNCTLTDTVAVYFAPIPQPNFEIIENCAGAATIFTSLSTGVLADSHYQWIFGDGDTLSNAGAVVSHLYENAGTYSVQLNIVNTDSGCAQSLTLLYEVPDECNPCNDENNLMLNGGFEQGTCPETFGQIANASFWQPTDLANPADLFNGCTVNDSVSVPANYYGNQVPYGGNAYAGFLAYSRSSGVNTPADQQYVSGNLFPLEPGQQYCVKMRVSLADSSSYAIDKLGLYFTVNNPVGQLNNLSNGTPQVENEDFDILLDKNVWTEVAELVTADSAYQYLTIGNFNYTDGDINTLFFPGGYTTGGAYYYIDNISVLPMQMTMPADTSICAGSSVTLTASTNTCSVRWVNAAQPNVVLSTSNSLVVTPTNPTTTYIFYGSNGACEISDTVRVHLLPTPDADIAASVVNVCANDNAILVATGGGAYEWALSNNFSNVLGNDDSLTVTPQQTATYFVRVTSPNGCFDIDSVLVKTNPRPIANAGADTLYVCSGDSIRLQGSGGVAFSWEPAALINNPNIADPFVQPFNNTTYYLTVTDSLGCTSAVDSVLVMPLLYPQVDSTIVMCAGDVRALNPYIPANAVSYSWSPGTALTNTQIANPITYSTTDITYTLSYTDTYGCVGTSVVSVTVNKTPNIIASDEVICLGESVTLNALIPDEPALAYFWMPATGISDQQAPITTATPTETTEYTVTVYYPNGQSCTDAVTIEVNNSGTAQLTASSNTICEGENIQLVVNTFGNINATYEWDNGIGTTTTPFVTVSPSVSTTYNVTVTNNNTGCQATASTSVAVTTVQAPIINTSTNLIYCSTPLQPVQICYNANYNGCLPIEVTAINRPANTINMSIANSFCFYYTPSFSAGRNDTIVVNICAGNTNFCSTLSTVVIYCDNAPSWPYDVLDATTCEDASLSIPLPVADVDADDQITITTTNTFLGSIGYNATENSLIFTPNQGASGSDQITVTACDALYPTNQCDSFTLNLAVTPNDAPAAANTTVVTTYQTTSGVFCLDVEDETFSTNLNYVVSATPAHGALIPSGTAGCYIYAPLAGFLGSDQATITVCDDCGKCDEAIISLFVTVPDNNLPPVTANTHTFTTQMGQPISACIPVTEPNNDAYSGVNTSLPSNGSIVVFNNNCFVFTPAPGFVGMQSISFQFCDIPFQACTTTTVNINVVSNIPPTINDKYVSIPYGNDVSAYICMDIVEPDGQPYTLAIINPADNGTAQVVSNNCLIYEANNGYLGNDTITVQTCDNYNNCSTATVYITILPPPNLPPVVTPAPSVTTTPSNPITTCIAYYDPNNDDVNFSLTSMSPNNGTVSIDENGCISYVPSGNYIGNVTIVVNVCDDAVSPACVQTTTTIIVEENPVNNPPVVTPAPGATIQPGQSTTTCIFAADPEGTAITFTLNNIVPTQGSAAVDANGCITYVANNTYTGQVNITVTVCDSGNPVACVNTTTAINVVAPPNNPPVVTPAPSVSTQPGQTVQTCIGASEPDGEGIVYNLVGISPLQGSASVDANGCITYTANGTYTGNVAITVSVCDTHNPPACVQTSTVINVVAPQNTPPVASPAPTQTINPSQTANACITALDVDGDLLTYTIASVTPPSQGIASVNAQGCITYVANATYTGTVTVTVNVCDGVNPCVQTTATIIVQPLPVNNPPLANNQTNTTPQNTPITICNFYSDPDGDALTVTFADVENGSVSTNGNCITFSPNGAFVGTETFTVTVSDGELSASATITINVTDTFIANDDVASTEDGVAVAIPVMNNDTHPQGAATVTIVTPPAQGTASVDANGNIVYIPPYQYSGTVTLTYEICQPPLGCDQAVVTITVNDNFYGQPDHVEMYTGDGLIDIPILDNDVLADADDVTIQIINESNIGAISVSNNVVTYIPSTGYTGVDTFYYIISANGYGVDTVMVIVDVKPQPQAPVAANDTISTMENTAVSVTVTANDSHPAGNSFVLSTVNEPQHGDVSFNTSTGVVTYTPDSGYSGQDAFSYTICTIIDGTSYCSTAVVVVTVSPTPPCTLQGYEVFTPNGDGKNEEFVIEGIDCNNNDQNEIVIFNRWGNIVYKADNYGANSNWWDGTFNNTGNGVPDGTYFYVLKTKAGKELQGYIEVHR